MKNKRFEYTGTVFGFTLNQAVKGKAFIVMTVIIPVLIAVGLFCASFLPSLSKDEETITKNVIIVDNTGFDVLGEGFKSLYDSDKYDLKVTTVCGGELSETCGKISQDNTDTIVISVDSDKKEQMPGFTITGVLPDWSEVPESELDELMDVVSMCVDSIKVYSSGIAMEKLTYLSSYVFSNVIRAGEEAETFSDAIIKIFVPMIFCLIMYMMVLLYGQSIGKIVVEEKNSKLMEMILTSIHPEGLITGKVLAMSLIAVGQMLLWVVGGILGYVLGDYLAKANNPEYVNVIADTIKNVMEGSTAFSPLSIVIAILSIIFGFCIFSFLSGLVASFASKPEELAGSMGLYNIVVVAGFILSYMLEMKEVKELTVLISILPVTSPFSLGAQVIVGNITEIQGIIGLLVMIVSCVVIAVLSATVYKKQVFYTGQNKLTKILSVFKLVR